MTDAGDTDGRDTPIAPQTPAEPPIQAVCDLCGAQASVAVRFRTEGWESRRWWPYCPLHDARTAAGRRGWQPWQIAEVHDLF